MNVVSVVTCAIYRSAVLCVEMLKTAGSVSNLYVAFVQRATTASFVTRPSVATVVMCDGAKLCTIRRGKRHVVHRSVISAKMKEQDWKIITGNLFRNIC